MIISPSIASSDVLHVADEVDFADKYFDDIHIDIEDGNAVEGISFGMKMAKGICKRATKPKSIHLEVMHPLKYLSDIKECNPEIVFIQTDVLDDPKSVVIDFIDAGINTGIAVGDCDYKNNTDYKDIYIMIKNVLVSTAEHDDPKQIYQKYLEQYGVNIHKQYGVNVWLDGGINYDIYQNIDKNNIYAVVMGRAIYQNKKLALEQYNKR